MERANECNTEFRYTVKANIEAFPPTPPSNPYRRVLGTPVTYGGEIISTAEGRVTFGEGYEQRRVWLPGVEIVSAHHDGKQKSHLIINRFHAPEGHGLAARAWYQNVNDRVRREYTEGPWGSSEQPSAVRWIDHQEVDRLRRLMDAFRQRPNRQSVLRDMVGLVALVNDEEREAFAAAQAEAAESAQRFQQGMAAIQEVERLPFHYGDSDSDVRL